MAVAVYNRLHSSVGGHQLARSIGLERILEEAHLSGELILTNRKLKDFPKTATKYNLTDTIIADLSRNRFCELPEEVTTFSFLETLLLYHNTIRTISESVKHLTSLTYLDLRSNQLSILPREICFLPLQVLLVSNNRLVSLPDELGRMDKLTDLDASYNQLSALPARIGELRSLRSFSLRSNQLMYLPRELTCLTLVSLDVSNNRIASLPLEIRQMTTLVEFSLENNPLTSPPASLCVRGLVHVFKFLETQATKDEKGSRAGGNYDGYTTLRRAPRYNTSGNVLDSNRVPKHHVDSGYSTCDGIDKRWSNDMPNIKHKNDSSPKKVTSPSSSPATTSGCNNLSVTESIYSSTNTIIDESAVNITTKTSAEESIAPTVETEIKQKQISFSPTNQKNEQQHLTYAHSSSSNGSSPDQEDLMDDQINHHSHLNNPKSEDKVNKNLGNIQTYREYKEALKQQRNQEISSVYKIKGQKALYDMNEAINCNVGVQEDLETRLNGTVCTKSIMKNGTNGMGNLSSDDSVVIPKKPIQKVIPSRNTELMSQPKISSLSAQLPALSNSSDGVSSLHDDKTIPQQHTNGDCSGYVKPNSPMKAVNGILCNNNSSMKFSPIAGMKSPVGNNITKLGANKTHRSVTWNHDIPTEKLSFTMRREFDRQREETELMTQLRSIIETRLKMTLPEDIASALTDGVILCHLANYVRPRSVASIHVPSPGVSKLTMARCRRNVDNFLEACRKIGVDEELICSCADVVPPSNNNDENGTTAMLMDEASSRAKLPNPSAVLKTVSALIALDCNPHHQQLKFLHQQQQQQQFPKKQKQSSQFSNHYQYQFECHEHHHHRRCEEEEHTRQPATSTNYQQTKTTKTTTTIIETVENSINSNESVANVTFVTAAPTRSTPCHIVASGDDDVGVDSSLPATDNDSVDSGGENQCVFGNLIRNSKIKAFQKIKMNLFNYNNNNNNNNNNYNNNSGEPLQTILESEVDILAAGGSVDGNYQMVNEKMTSSQQYSNHNQESLALNVAGMQSSPVKTKFKLLEISLNDDNEHIHHIPKSGDPMTIVSKRIEFFEEHSTTPTGGTGDMTQAVVARSGVKKMKNTIFSIYRGGGILDLGIDSATQRFKNPENDEEPFLRHDSNILTVVLSCVFIVTFLLLIVFPLPG